MLDLRDGYILDCGVQLAASSIWGWSLMGFLSWEVCLQVDECVSCRHLLISSCSQEHTWILASCHSTGQHLIFSFFTIKTLCSEKQPMMFSSSPGLSLTLYCTISQTLMYWRSQFHLVCLYVCTFTCVCVYVLTKKKAHFSNNVLSEREKQDVYIVSESLQYRNECCIVYKNICDNLQTD